MWDYFRRVGRGAYQVMSQYRRVQLAAEKPGRKQAKETAEGAKSRFGSRRETIHAVIQKDDTAYRYLTSDRPSVISIFVPHGSLMNAIAMPSCGTLV